MLAAHSREQPCCPAGSAPDTVQMQDLRRSRLDGAYEAGSKKVQSTPRHHLERSVAPHRSIGTRERVQLSYHSRSPTAGGREATTEPPNTLINSSSKTRGAIAHVNDHIHVTTWILILMCSVSTVGAKSGSYEPNRAPAMHCCVRLIDDHHAPHKGVEPLSSR